MSLEEEEEARTIDIHQKRPSHWVAEELVHQGEESFQFHRGPRVGKRESSLTLFRIVKKLFFPSKTLMKQETTLKTRETVANMLQREEDVKANDPEMIDNPFVDSRRLLFVVVAKPAEGARTRVGNDAGSRRRRRAREEYVREFRVRERRQNDPRNGGDALRESAREVLEMCCVHLGALKDINWEQFSRRLQRLMPTEQFCSKDEVLNKIKLELFEATRRKKIDLDQKARKNSRKFKNALRQFMERTMDKVNLELASGRATSIDQLAMHHQDGWLSMRNAHVNWNRF